MGEVFAGRYELIDLIGEGGMGTIWVAHDRRTDALVAAKVLRQGDAGTLLRFVREQAVRIHDPNVLTPIGWAGEDDRVLFTMPIVRGGSVATVIGDHGPLPPLLVAELLRQLLSGLAAVHAAGLVHRDVKPANLLLDATGTGRPRLHLSDFGIAVDLKAPRWTETGLVSGTPGYLSPELEATGTVTPAVDLYAAGQVALTMLTSQRPADRTALVRPEGVPDPLWSVVTSLVAAEPGDRPESARAAGELLAGPELAWRDGAMGEVEILDQVRVDGPEATRPRHIRRTPVMAEAAVLAAGPEAVQAPSGSRPDVSGDRSVRSRWAGPLVAAGIAVLALVGGLLVWSPWDAGSGAPSSSTPPASSSASPTSTPSGTPVSSPTPSPSASTPTAVSSSPGSVSVGRVVVRVGQPCEFVDVGRLETTVTGVKVACRLQPDGSYSWLEP